MSAEITHVLKKNSEGSRKRMWMMSERIGSHGWRVWKEKGLPQEVVPLSDAESVVAKLEEEKQALLRAVRAGSWFVEATPENDLYYALNKYCVEAADAMIEALKEVEHLLD